MKQLALALSCAIVAGFCVIAQDGGEIANGQPRSSLGSTVPVPVGTKGQTAVSFIQPRRFYTLAPPTGTEIPVQVRIEPDRANRAYLVRWDGESCGGSHGKTLDGDLEPALQQPFNARAGDGLCTFVALVIGSGGSERGRAQFVMHVNIA